MKHTILFAFAAAGLTFIAGLPTAHANGEAGPNPIYQITVQGNSVLVCPQGPTDRVCPDPSGMLRQDTASQQVVRLDDFCEPVYLFHCYVDECVPKGTYVYGLASPYECCTDCAQTDYVGVAVVQSDLPADCTRSEGNAGPTPYAEAAPWPAYDPQGAWPEVCDTAKGGTTESGCGIHRGTRASILGLHLFVAALGAWLLSRRRKNGSL